MASSKREEERNEKIIRGLMKLPPNRRCINCNSLGPQYVCSNFWTFVCTICSGIHREFTHRVKSVSMSKFTSQEVEALQNGGNQRAREAYLKDWDLQRQRMPNSSDVDKVREFIKVVYVDRKYAGGNKSEKPLQDSETEKNTVDDIRRASSYHSYSQSPPYDFQYEDRLNRKQGNSLSKKPGSDRGLFGRKTASFVYSPGRFSDHFSEDRFANEGSSSRVSDYSVSSGGDPFRSSPQSPNLQRDDEFSSPTLYSSKDVVDGLEHQTKNSNSELSTKRDADKIPVPRPQRTVSTGSFGVHNRNSGSLQSVGPVSTQNKISSFVPHSQLPAESSGGLNHFDFPSSSSGQCTAPAVDLFQAPITASIEPVDIFQSPGNSTTLLHTSTSSSSSYLSGATGNPSTNLKLPGQGEPASDGWATFDSPQYINPASTNALDARISAGHSEVEKSVKNMNSVSSSNIGVPWLDFKSTPVHGPGPSISNPWMESPQNNHVTMNVANSQPWNAFGEGDGNQQKHVEVKGSDLQVFAGSSSSSPDLFAKPWNAFGEADGQQQRVDMQGTYLEVSTDNSSPALHLFAEDSTRDGFHKPVSTEGFSFPTLSSHFAPGVSFNQPLHPFMNDVGNIQQKYSNPFDIPFDSEFEASNVFLDMSSLQAALPITADSSPYGVGPNDSWFSPNSMGSQGGMSYIASESPNPRLPPNVPPAHAPAASVGGNPFA